MTYPDAIQFLYGLQLFGAHFGLERAERLAALAGHPERRLRFIHVAGTNGKGSTCAMLESIYRAAGLRTGLFTSPHLVSFRERLQVNRRLISEADTARLVAEIQPLLRQFSDDAHPTMFEVVAVMALKYFAEQRCDLVIWETGLGGRLDATNIVTPLASIITNIALDHQQWLGDTRAKIAAEKAGIIKPGVPVLTAADAPEARAVIETVARQNNAPLTVVGQASRLSAARASRPRWVNEGETPVHQTGGTPVPLALPLIGEHQQRNAALAVATVEVLQKQIPVAAAAIHAGLASVVWPGRFQLLQNPDGRKILLDGAHNPDGAETLRATMKSQFPDRHSLLIFGALADKDWPAICRLLAPLAAKIFTVPVASGRTADPSEIAAEFRAANPGLAATALGSLAEALAAGKAEPLVLITGSLYLIGEALERLGVSPADAGERGLNEWSPTLPAR